MLSNISNSEWLRRNRDKLAFCVSLFMLSAVMSVWWEMFRFAKDLRVPAWSRILPYPYLLPYYMVIISLLPAAFVTKSFRNSFLSVFACVLISPLWPSIMVLMSVVYNPVINGLLSYLFVLVWICMLPLCLLVLIRVVYIFLKKINVKL
jgi:hypothetical protein